MSLLLLLGPLINYRGEQHDRKPGPRKEDTQEDWS
jgi:hypothetical protein